MCRFLNLFSIWIIPLKAGSSQNVLQNRKDISFHSDKSQTAAFQNLKNMCCEAPVLAYYDVRKMQCDDSKNAAGAVVLQEGRPIAYASRKFRDSELNCAPIENEILAIVCSTQKYREYSLGKTLCCRPTTGP